MLKELLAHPLTRGLDLDDPRTTLLGRRIINKKRFLWLVYRKWYRGIAAALPLGCFRRPSLLVPKEIPDRG